MKQSANQIEGEAQGLQTWRSGHLAAAKMCCTSLNAPRRRVTSDGVRHGRRSEVRMVIALISAGLVAMRIVAGDVPCLNHADCKAGEFCGMSLADSYEGWNYHASICKPCSQCECHIDSSTAICPADRSTCLNFSSQRAA